jgi:hypothetical protein
MSALLAVSSVTPGGSTDTPQAGPALGPPGRKLAAHSPWRPFFRCLAGSRVTCSLSATNLWCAGAAQVWHGLWCEASPQDKLACCHTGARCVVHHVVTQAHGVWCTMLSHRSTVCGAPCCHTGTRCVVHHAACCVRLQQL